MTPPSSFRDAFFKESEMDRPPSAGCRVAQMMLMLLMLAASTANAQCQVDTLHRSGFDTPGQGVGIDGHLAGLTVAVVELRSGSDVLATVEAQAGIFSLDVPAVPPGTMLELRARGLEAQAEAFIELTSYVGTIGHLLDRSRFDSRVRVAELPAVALTARNTATYAMLQRAHPGDPVADECELATRIAALDQGEVLNAAAVTKIVMADGGFAAGMRSASVPLGGGPGTTLELLLDPVAFDNEVAAIEAEAPGRIAALEAVLGEPFCERFDPEAILVHGLGGQQLNSLGGEIYQGIDATSGTHVNAYGADSYQWQCAGDTMDIVFEGERVTLDYPVRVIDGVPQQVTAELRTSSARLTRIDSDAGFVAVTGFSVGERSFPFHPVLPTEHFGDDDPWALVRERTGTPYDAVTISGSYLLPASGLEGDRSARAVLLDPAHTGIDLDGGFAPITWDVSPDGELLLSFPDRDVRIIPLRDEAPSVSQVVALVQFDNGARAIAHRLALHATDAPWWTSAAAIQGAYLQHAGRVSGDNTFRIEIQPGNYAPTFQTFFAGEFAGQEFPLLAMYWSFISGEKSVVLRHCVGTDENGDPIERSIVDRNPAFGECDQFYRYRRLSLYTSNGNDLYFREDNMDWYSDPTLGDPPWYQHSRPILYRYSSPGPVLP